MERVYRWLALCLWCALLVGATGAGSEQARGQELEAARAALVSGDFKTAGERYAGIGSKSPEFADRLVDSLRYQLLFGKPVEAYRLHALLDRLGLGAEPYYAALSLALARTCPLAVEFANPEFALLLQAYYNRQAHQFQGDSFEGSPLSAENARLSYLGPGQTPYLDEIKTLRLQAGSGCRFDEADKEDEIKILKEWYEGWASGKFNEPLAGRDLVASRLLALALKAKDEELATTILQRYVVMSDAEWLSLPDPERRYLFQALIDAKALPPDWAKAGRWRALVEELVLKGSSGALAEWLTLIDYASLPNARQEEIVRHLLSFPDLPARGYFLFEAARLAYLKGDPVLALGFVRRLVVQNEAQDAQATDGASQIALEILSEYRFDEKLLGAIETSLPKATWQRVFSRLAVRHAWVGNRAGFDHALAQLPSRRIKHEPVLRAMVTRDLRKLGDLLDAMRVAELKRVAGEIGSEAVDIPGREELAPIFRVFADRLRNKNADEAVQQLFQTGVLNQVEAGAETVRTATVIAGAVSIHSATQPLPWPLQFRAPSSPPRRQLLAVPADVIGRGFQIQ